MGRDYVWDKLEFFVFVFFKKASLPIKRVCVCVCVCVRAPARVHKIKVHTNLLTLATVRSRRIEVEVSFHTFKKKKTFTIMSVARHSSDLQPYQDSKFPGEPGPPARSYLDPGRGPAFQPLISLWHVLIKFVPFPLPSYFKRYLWGRINTCQPKMNLIPLCNWETCPLKQVPAIRAKKELARPHE